MSGVQVLTSTMEKEVVLLSDAAVEFVSLVRHGANQMPFRVIKSMEKGGGNKDMNLAIQSILISKESKLEDLSAVEGLEWLAEAKADNAQDYKEYKKYIQLPSEKFNSNSMQLLKIRGDTWVLAGQLANGDEEGVLTLGKSDAEKANGIIPIAPMDAMVGDVDAAQQAALATSFRDLFERELGSMLDIVYGSLKQTSADHKKRKTSILTAVDSFKSFLSMGLDAIGPQATKMEKFVVGTKTDLKGGENMELFKDKEEFTEAVKEIVAAVVEGVLKKQEEDDPGKKAAEDQAAKDAASAAEGDIKKEEANKSAGASEEGKDMAAVIKSVDALTKKVEEQGKNLESYGDQLETAPVVPGSEDEAVNKTDKDKKGKPEPSVFSGLLTKVA